jgi:hypothetical protein
VCSLELVFALDVVDATLVVRVGDVVFFCVGKVVGLLVG